MVEVQLSLLGLSLRLSVRMPASDTSPQSPSRTCDITLCLQMHNNTRGTAPYTSRWDRKSHVRPHIVQLPNESLWIIPSVERVIYSMVGRRKYRNNTCTCNRSWLANLTSANIGIVLIILPAVSVCRSLTVSYTFDICLQKHSFMSWLPC